MAVHQVLREVLFCRRPLGRKAQASEGVNLRAFRWRGAWYSASHLPLMPVTSGARQQEFDKPYPAPWDFLVHRTLTGSYLNAVKEVFVRC